MKKLIFFTMIAVAMALAACNKKDGGSSSGGGTTATTPQPCNINGQQSNSCNPGVYNGNGTGWLAYNNNSNSCACPSGSILVYNSSYGLGCAPVGQYQQNQFVVVNGQTLNINTMVYNGGSNSCGFNSAYYSCDLRVSNSCANLGGGTCVATGGGTAIGVCSNSINNGNNTGVINNGTNYWPNNNNNNNNNCRYYPNQWGGYSYYCYSSWNSGWYKPGSSGSWDNAGGIPR